MICQNRNHVESEVRHQHNKVYMQALRSLRSLHIGTGNNQYLKQVRLPIVPYSQCRSWYGKQVTDHMICAGYEAGGRSACQVCRL